MGKPKSDPFLAAPVLFESMLVPVPFGIRPSGIYRTGIAWKQSRSCRDIKMSLFHVCKLKLPVRYKCRLSMTPSREVRWHVLHAALLTDQGPPGGVSNQR